MNKDKILKGKKHTLWDIKTGERHDGFEEKKKKLAKKMPQKHQGMSKGDMKDLESGDLSSFMRRRMQ